MSRRVHALARRAGLLALALGAACSPARPPATSAPSAAVPSCAADFDSTVAIVARDYSGFASGLRPSLPAESARAGAAAEPGERECTRAILRWVESFGDPHLTVYGRSTGAPAPRPAAGRPRGGRAFSLRFPDDSTAVLRLPTFELARRGAIDSLVAANRARLLATPYLVIDVRGNGGGWSGSYRSVLPLLYTGPIHVRGIETWATPGNVGSLRGDLSGTPPELAEQIRAVIPRMEAAPGTFVPLQPDSQIRMDTVHPLPRAVALLVDRGCASACEQLVLEARQSGKVTVLGAESTRGALDYLNVRTVPLPSGVRSLRLPISRLAGLPAEAVNAGGLAPGVLVPPGEADAVAFALRHLRGRD